MTIEYTIHDSLNADARDELTIYQLRSGLGGRV